MAIPKKLLVLVPTPTEVAYTPPNPDGSQKKCGNCWKWDVDSPPFSNAGFCMEVTGRFQDTDVCNQHVYGDPYKDAVVKLSPSLAGVARTGRLDGTSCSTCRFFDEDESLCLVNKDPDAGRVGVTVEPLGCCNRWAVADGI